MNTIISALIGIAVGILLGLPWGYAISHTDIEEIEEEKRRDFD